MTMQISILCHTYAKSGGELLYVDALMPHPDGLAYWQKAPLQYWDTAISYRLFGIHEWTARLWAGLTSLLTVETAFLFAVRNFGARTARWSADVLASCALFVLPGHQLTLDASMTLGPP
jgi:4-amino-4-deoxy-L-arabinose transferase-like glycosyltransferase